MNNKNYRKQRKSLRLNYYDYSNEGYYFVTICLKNRINFFGKIENEKVYLSEIGDIAKKNWCAILSHFNYVKLDEFVIMPNHIHGIVIIDYETGCTNTVSSQGHAIDLRDNRHKVLPVVIGSFKSAVTKEVNRKYAEAGFKWQTSYYEHIIRNEESLRRIREYILLNPIKWEFDRENLINKSKKIKEFWEKE